MRRFIYTSIIVAVSLLSTSCHWLVSWAPPEFVPRKTVETGFIYNYFHIGNARPFVVFDTLRRYFIWRGYEVKYVQNFTDVDDKIINRAREEGITAPEVSEKYIKEYFA